MRQISALGERHETLTHTTPQEAALRTHRQAFDSLAPRDTGRVRLHHRWDDDEDRPEPDLTDPATAAALTQPLAMCASSS